MIDKRVPQRYSTYWKEVYEGGSQGAEERLFATYNDRIKRVQEQLKKREGAPFVRRAFHAKLHAGFSDHIGVVQAQFRVIPDLAKDLHIGFFRPAAIYRATVRLSSASGTIQSDAAPDLRGIALRVFTEDGIFHDFLLTDAAASHARDARQFMVAAEAMASRWKVVSFIKLLLGLGLFETIRMVRVLQRDARKIDSLATDQFWSRAPCKFGPYAVKFTLQPASNTAGDLVLSGESYLKEDLVRRLLEGTITYDFRVQRYVDEATTPIEDGTIEWKESNAPFETIAQLVIPQQDLRTAASQEAAAEVDDLEFNPWNTTDDFRPLGNLNRARRTVYQASANYRSGRTDDPPSSPLAFMSKVAGFVLVMATLLAGLRYVKEQMRRV